MLAKAVNLSPSAGAVYLVALPVACDSIPYPGADPLVTEPIPVDPTEAKTTEPKAETKQAPPIS